MRVRVLFFAVTREVAQCDEAVFNLPHRADLNTLKEAILRTYPNLSEYFPFVRWAVNESFTSEFALKLEDDDEVAIIPPVSGGQSSYFVHEPILPEQLLSDATDDENGATVMFVGTVRIRTNEHVVTQLEYEVYESMANKTIESIIEKARAQWSPLTICIRHRIGVVEVGGVSVVIIVGSPHRDAAYQASRFIIEELKRDVPIFKREVHIDGSHWVGIGS